MFTFLVGGKHENVTFGEKQIVKKMNIVFSELDDQKNFSLGVKFLMGSVCPKGWALKEAQCNL